MAHRIAGDHRLDLGHALGRSEAQRQPVSVTGKESVGAAKHGILLVQDHRGTLRHQTSGEHRRDAGISAEADHRRGMDAPEDPSRLKHAASQRHDGLARTQRPTAGNSRTADDKMLEPGEHRALNSARARIGHQCHAPPARQQFARQRLGREEVAAGSAGRDHDGKHRRPSHGMSP